MYKRKKDTANNISLFGLLTNGDLALYCKRYKTPADVKYNKRNIPHGTRLSIEHHDFVIEGSLVKFNARSIVLTNWSIK